MARAYRVRIIDNPGLKFRLWRRAVLCWYACDWQGLIWAGKRLIQMERAGRGTA